MKPDNTNVHERARMMIALFGSGISAASKFPESEFSEREFPKKDQAWLTAHLESCTSCREFAETSGEAIRSLRATPVMASASLVSTTQMRVRQRAQELQQHQERLWVISICCAAVTLCTAISTVALWRGFVWMGATSLGQTWMIPRVSPPLVALGFVVLGVMPAIVTGIILLARGTHLADHNGPFQG